MDLVFSLTKFLLGGTAALAICTALFQPGLQLFRPEFYNRLVAAPGAEVVKCSSRRAARRRHDPAQRFEQQRRLLPLPLHLLRDPRRERGVRGRKRRPG